MLTVPHLKPGQTPYDPALYTLTQVIEDPVIASDSHDSDSPAQPSLTTLLHHSLVKDALTSLHQEDNDNFALLQTHSALQLCTMEKDHKTFLENQKQKYLSTFPSTSLKQLFIAITPPYFAWSTQRVSFLYQSKVNSYRQEVIERQNLEFLNLAIQPENAFDDSLQTTYRDMILFNLDTLYESLPDDDRKQRLNQSSHTFYTKVIEKRLELDPSRLGVMLTASVVKRCLSPEELKKYQALATDAMRRDEWKRQARSWIDDDTDLSTVKKSIVSLTKTDADQMDFQSIYTNILNSENKKRCLGTILNAMNVWSLVVENGAKLEAIPPWVSRVNPELYAYITRAIKKREEGGGLPVDVDYGAIIKFIRGFDYQKALSHFSDELYLYSFIEKAGGVDSSLFGVILRLLLGSLEEEDGRWIADITLAYDVCVELFGRDFLKQGGNDFLKRFDSLRQIRISNKDGKFIDELEIRSLLTDMLQFEKAVKQ